VTRRFIVYGAGAIGGVIGARLAQSGHDVALIARGAHGEAMARDGLTVHTPDRTSVHRLAVHADPAALDWRDGDIVLLTVKSQDTVAALERLEAAAGPDVAVVCVQNGVSNEREALRRFGRTYSVCVQLPAGHVEPGVVVVFSGPVTGSLDIGRHPAGVDDLAEEIAAAFASSGFVSQAREDIARWKYAKLLRNTQNAVKALCGADGGELVRRARAEGEAVLSAAGIQWVADAEYDERHASIVTLRPVPGQSVSLGSSWQSLARGSGSIEADHLNGEIVLEARMHGLDAPVNELLRACANDAARRRLAPGSVDERALLARLPAAGPPGTRPR
jgi:2-dehydropantoate 2-reductase